MDLRYRDIRDSQRLMHSCSAACGAPWQAGSKHHLRKVGLVLEIRCLSIEKYIGAYSMFACLDADILTCMHVYVRCSDVWRNTLRNYKRSTRYLKTCRRCLFYSLRRLLSCPNPLVADDPRVYVVSGRAACLENHQHAALYLAFFACCIVILEGCWPSGSPAP